MTSVVEVPLRAWRLFDTYVRARMFGPPSTASFWYSPTPIALSDIAAHAAYLDARPSPFYPIDYRSRTKFKFQNVDDIIILPYGGGIGPQINPEAAFQFALGLHDRWLDERTPHLRSEFLRYAKYFLGRQKANGDWVYAFDWYESKAPWISSLAQTRGASVMLRAFLLTNDQSYSDAAICALSKLHKDVKDGGVRAGFKENGACYFEEYPHQLNATLNGFIAALFGVWEVATWLGDRPAKTLFDEGLKSLESMLTFYTLSWWTLYDYVSGEAIPNVHSPRYHEMCTDYLVALSTISQSPIIEQYAQQWRKLDTMPHRATAYAVKIVRKLAYR